MSRLRLNWPMIRPGDYNVIYIYTGIRSGFQDGLSLYLLQTF